MKRSLAVLLLAALAVGCGQESDGVRTSSASLADEAGLNCTTEKFARVSVDVDPKTPGSASAEEAVDSFLDERWPGIPVRFNDGGKAESFSLASSSTTEGAIDLVDDGRVVATMTTAELDERFAVTSASICSETMTLGVGADPSEKGSFQEVGE